MHIKIIQYQTSLGNEDIHIDHQNYQWLGGEKLW